MTFLIQMTSFLNGNHHDLSGNANDKITMEVMSPNGQLIRQLIRFTMGKTQSFKDLIDTYYSRQWMCWQDLIFTYRCKLLNPSQSPSDLKLIPNEKILVRFNTGIRDYNI